jgi:hypothetical protein
MSLDPTARESNVRDSVKKYFVDNLNRGKGVEVSFDKTLAAPAVQGIEVKKWIMIAFRDLQVDNLSTQSIEIFCCTKQDSEGFVLTQLRDTVTEYLIDNTKTDGMARIPLYRSHPTDPWVQVGTMVVQIETESPSMDGPDGTKFKVIPILLRWGATF